MGGDFTCGEGRFSEQKFSAEDELPAGVIF
jgi:hypothetical protein